MKKHILNLKTGFYFLILIFVSSLFIFGLGSAALAEEFTLTPPGVTEGKTPEFIPYLDWLLKFLLGSVGILATLMIIVGGLQYVAAGASGNPEKVSDAKNRILMAIGGLILALSSWLILSVINPDLLRLELTLPGITETNQEENGGKTKKYYDVCLTYSDSSQSKCINAAVVNDCGGCTASDGTKLCRPIHAASQKEADAELQRWQNDCQATAVESKYYDICYKKINNQCSSPRVVSSCNECSKEAKTFEYCDSIFATNQGEADTRLKNKLKECQGEEKIYQYVCQYKLNGNPGGKTYYDKTECDNKCTIAELKNLISDPRISQVKITDACVSDKSVCLYKLIGNPGRKIYSSEQECKEKCNIDELKKLITDTRQVEITEQCKQTEK